MSACIHPDKRFVLWVLCIFLFPCLAQATIIDYMPSEDAKSLQHLIPEGDSRNYICLHKKGAFVVDKVIPRVGEIKAIQAHTIDPKDRSTIALNIDYSDLDMVDSSYVPSLLKRGRKLAIEYYDCKDSGSREIASVRRIE